MLLLNVKEEAHVVELAGGRCKMHEIRLHACLNA